MSLDGTFAYIFVGKEGKLPQRVIPDPLALQLSAHYNVFSLWNYPVQSGHTPYTEMAGSILTECLKHTCVGDIKGHISVRNH